MVRSVAVAFGSKGTLHPVVRAWAGSADADLIAVSNPEELMAIALRGRPRYILFDAHGEGADSAHAACRRIKRDSYTGVVPCAVLCGPGSEALLAAFESNADEVISDDMTDAEVRCRLDVLLARSARNLDVHPSTRLPGAPAIEGEVMRRILSNDLFAVCYADLDHFKEFNDRYSFEQGDRVIRIVAKILHDVVKGICGESGFVGHIGGDDFIFVIPYEVIADVCSEITSVFDLLVPYQYSEHDRRAGYFFGKDRRGVLGRVPLMTLSIGVVTNAQRKFTSVSQINLLATEMKGFAKSKSGSLYAVDRRVDDRLPAFELPHPVATDEGKTR